MMGKMNNISEIAYKRQSEREAIYGTSNNIG